MSKTSLISEMLKFHFGNRVVYADGEEGYLAYVIFDPTTRQMTHIGVKQGRFFGKTTHFPFAAVARSTREGVFLNVKRADAAAVASAEVQGAIFDQKTSVENTSTGARGTLMLIAVHPENAELAYLAVHNLRPGQDTFLPQTYVIGLETGLITIAVPEAKLKELPPYRSDDALQQEVERILYDFTPLHVDLKGIRARVLDGVLYLDGNISSSLRGDIARDQVSGVAGLMEIKNNLIGDDTLAADLAMALGRDPRTRDLPIGVYPRLGVVRLSGAVHNSQQKSAADEIAKNFPGVISVINDLVVDPQADLLHVMSSSEGGEAEDKVPGKYIRHTK
ncbi:MAG: BON domain-containing protein [Ktedonobacteraceae bacterium]